MFQIVTGETIVPLVLRLGLCVFFVLHAREKVSAESDYGGAWANNPEPPPASTQYAVAWGEMVIGAAVGVGLLTRVVAIAGAALTVFLSGALFADLSARGLSLLRGENQYNIVVLAACLSLVLLGGGTVSADRLFHWWRKR
jgi:uncharacterized membrane protein YphA (DoxX/SURF4 family)